MSSVIRAFGRTDLAGIRRDPMLRMMVVAPFIYVALVRFPVPPLTEMLRDSHAFDLAPYHPLIVSFLLVVGCAPLLGVLGGLIIMEEKDTGTLGALRVTPVSMATYAAYRGGTIVVVTTIYAVVCTLLSGIDTSVSPIALVAAALCSGAVAGQFAVVMAIVSRDKVEGLAIARALGMVTLLVPVVPYFLPAAWQVPFALLPSYWPFKIYWVAADSGTVWPYALAGLAYNALLLLALIRAFNRSTIE